MGEEERQQVRVVLGKIWEEIREFVVDSYWRKKTLFTAWSEEKRGLRSVGWMRLVAAMFLGDLPRVADKIGLTSNQTDL